MQQIDQLAACLLRERSMCLRSVQRIVHEILRPAVQTDFALDRGQRELTKAIGYMNRRLTHVDRDQLTDEQQKANVDALGKLAQMRAAMHKPRKALFDRD